ncbi:TPA: hypothetical protein N0F65_007990 [Lagenidium giganteum]|uniref:Uncharacterized protein n=1 Tax=Lagenidium giganteum TaxID=4803 RepID=A0AAV2YQR7_9STRA|nr:TPA: hypothetical protein N0F65_007990 [Lagenidium giganteum]
MQTCKSRLHQKIIYSSIKLFGYILPEEFYRGVNDVAQKAVNTRAYIKGRKTPREVVDDHVMKYLDKQKEFRKEDSNRRRKAMADKFAEEAKYSLTRQLFQDSDDAKSSDDEEVKEEKRLRGLNAGKYIYTDDINSYKSSYANNLYESIAKDLAKLLRRAKAQNILKTMLRNRQENIKCQRLL